MILRKHLLASFLLALAPRLWAAPLSLTPLDLGEIPGFKEDSASENLSGASILSLSGQDASLLLVSDEGTEFTLLPLTGQAPRFVDLIRLPGFPQTPASPPDEIDMEAAATLGDHLFLCPSASLKRRKAKGRKRKKSLRRLGEILLASGRGRNESNFLYELGPGSQPGSWRILRRMDLRRMLLKLPLLHPFREIPSKDNGLDVEGFAATQDRLYFGLRGPALREHAVVVSTGRNLEDPHMHFLHLSGLGIRGLETLPQREGEDHPRIAVLAGPTMPIEAPYRVYLWDGERDSFGKPRKGLALLGDIQTPITGSKAEGIFFWQGFLHLVFDGPEGGGIQRIQDPLN
jgi:hypothetical protein